MVRPQPTGRPFRSVGGILSGQGVAGTEEDRLGAMFHDEGRAVDG